MAVSIQVPLNTMLADLDESLRQLLKRELGRHGFDGVEIAFEAPDKEWAASLSSPTVNVFLYDLRESTDFRPVNWKPERENGRERELRPPLRLEASYSVTAWTRAVEDEHRLLSQVLAVLYAYPAFPEDALAGALSDPVAQRYPLTTKVGQMREEGKADFWTAVGGQYKASLDYIVSLSCEPGTVLERGPEVRTHTVRLNRSDGRRATVLETNTVGSVVVNAEGAPIGDAWVRLVEKGDLAVTDRDGRFKFREVGRGTFHMIARTPEGGEVEIEFTVPGPIPDLVISSSAKPAAKRRG